MLSVIYITDGQNLFTLSRFIHHRLSVFLQETLEVQKQLLKERSGSRLICCLISSALVANYNVKRYPDTLQLKPSAQFISTACWTIEYLVVHSEHNWTAWIGASGLVYFEIKNKKLKFWPVPSFTILDDSWFYFYKIYCLFF